MFKSYFRTAFRNLSRDRYYAFINILGLAVAIACCLILGLYLKNEFSYDQHNVNHQRIFRVVNLLNTNGFIEDFALTPQLLGPLLQRDHPEVQGFVRFQRLQTTLMRHADLALYQDSVMFADQNVFAEFSHEIIAGDPDTALVDPLSIAISDSFAQAYFGNADPMGKILTTDTSSYRVTLVYKDLPENSHFRYDALLSFNRLSPYALSDLASEGAQNSLGGTSTYNYLVMPDDYDIEEFKAISDAFWQRYMAPIFSASTVHDYYLEPLADIHLHSTTIGDYPKGNKTFVYSLMAIGIFLLLVASINYINLATARAARRTKEVSMRKVLGSSRQQLVMQFLGESLFFVVLALPLALLLSELAIAWSPINNLLRMTITNQQLLAPATLFSLVGGALLLGVLSGLYPAFFLSSILPGNVSAGLQKTNSNKSFVRHGLVLIQFVISIGVIACTLLMFSQIQYFYSKSLGFDKENKIVLRVRNNDVFEQLPVVKNRLLQNPQILGLTTSSSLPGGGFGINSGQVENNQGALETRVFNYYQVGEDYLDVMGIEITGGRNFNSAIPTDNGGALIVNETAVSYMGWDDAIGKQVFGLTVVGVMNDFNFHNLSREMEPLAILYDPEAGSAAYLTLNISGEEIDETIEHVRAVWQEFDSEHPFDFQFLDAQMNDLYNAENRQMTLVGIFAGLCVFISSLGLLGLTAFTTEQRSKEIGIRKVLGASAIQVILMLFRSVFVVVITASLIASVISYWIINRWLLGFAYHTEINYWIFVVATVFCISIAFVTMAVQSWKTSHSNPVEALRYE